jgi:purine nucleosidase
LVGWQTSRGDVGLNQSDIASILRFNNPVARFAIECNSRAREAYKEQTGEDGISLPDPVAMSVALDPTIGNQWSEHFVEVESRTELTRGMTVVDRLNVAKDERNRATWADVLAIGKKTKICWTIDNRRWKEMLFAACDK